MSSSTTQLQDDIEKTLDWFEEENSLWVVIVTGTGRAFCAGQGQARKMETILSN